MKDKINWFITLLFIILIFFLITLLINNLVDSKISNIEIRLPGTQYGGVDSLVNMDGPPVADLVPGAVVPVVPAADAALAAATAEAAAIATAAAAPVAPAPAITPAPAPAITPAAATPAPAAAGSAAPGAPLKGQSVQSKNPPVVKTCSVDADCNKQPGQTGNVCKADKTCYCVTGSGKVCEIMTFYKDPKNMSPDQLQKFKMQADFSKMTLGDYMNWLGLYRNDIATLSKNFPSHLKNFEKFLTGQLITIQELDAVKNSKNRITGLDTAQNLYNQYLGDERSGTYPAVFASYPSDILGIGAPNPPLPTVSDPLPAKLS
jgi:hypothetical protein